MKKYTPLQIFLIVIFFPLSLVFLFLKNALTKPKNTDTFYIGHNAELNNKVDRINLRNADTLNTDLVEATFHLACCS
mgnify:CR=1 FL=1